MENLSEALGIKQEPSGGQNISRQGAEKTLKAFATIILILGIMACVILLIAGFVMVADNEESGWSFILAAIPVLFGSLVQWAFITVICNISNNLREINRKMK